MVSLPKQLLDNFNTYDTKQEKKTITQTGFFYVQKFNITRRFLPLQN